MSAEENPLVADLRAAKDKKGKAPRTLLPSPAPTPGSPHEEVAAWLTVALALGEDPIAGAERYGRHVDARMVLVLTSGQRITFERAADAFDPGRLVQTVMTATGAQVAPYGRPDALHIAGSMIRLSELLAEDDARGEAAEWGRTFLEGAKPNAEIITDFSSPLGRWDALCTLTDWKAPPDVPSYAPPAQRAALLIDGTNGDRMVRTSDFAAHARGVAGRPIAWASLHGRMLEVGWLHPGELQQRHPGGQGKRKARVYVIPANWEHE